MTVHVLAIAALVAAFVLATVLPINLGAISLVAALVTIVANIAVGAYSDRTLARRGRRQVWVLVGAVVTIVGLVFQGYQQTVLGMVVIWALVQIGLSSISAA